MLLMNLKDCPAIGTQDLGSISGGVIRRVQLAQVGVEGRCQFEIKAVMAKKFTSCCKTWFKL